jgi:zinc/manganese transport system substrate-binding protein
MLDRRSLLLASAATLVVGAAAAQTPAPAAAPAPATAPAAPRLPVVATFSILGDMVANVGGERIALTTLVGADEDAHVYQPRPADGRALAAARVVVINGLSFEGWIRRLIRSSGTRATVVEATNGITRIRAATGHSHSHSHGHGHSHGEWDPHAWQSVTEARRYVANIRDALIAADGEGRDVYTANAAAYDARLAALDAEIRATIGRIPQADRKAITTHDAFEYFERDYGFRFIGAQGISTDAEPSAQQIARLIRQIRQEGVKAVFAENISNPRLVERIAREGGARMGGTLFSDALSVAGGPAATYIDLMRHNARAIAGALTTA